MNVSKAVPSIMKQARGRHAAGAAALMTSMMTETDPNSWTFIHDENDPPSPTSSLSQELWTRVPDRARQVVIDSGVKPGTAVRVTERLVDKFVHDPYVLACVEKVIEEETDSEGEMPYPSNRLTMGSQSVQIEVLPDGHVDGDDHDDSSSFLETLKQVFQSIGRFVRDGVMQLGELIENIFVHSASDFHKPDPITNTLIGTVTIIAAIGTVLTLLSH